MYSAIIKLVKPIKWHETTVSGTKLRQPTGQNHIDFSRPTIPVASPGRKAAYVRVVPWPDATFLSLEARVAA